MRPDLAANPAFLAAFRVIVGRIDAALANVPAPLLPIRMFVAGGTAVHCYTGARFSVDVDAAFSHRILLPDDLDVVYDHPEGGTRMLYFNRQYNETFALFHEDAHANSVPLENAGAMPGILDVRLLSPLDLAVSKISRFAEQDRADITALATRGLIGAPTCARSPRVLRW